MVLSEVNETSTIAKVRILVEQVIKGINFIKILATEMWISMLEIVDDIFLLCAAIWNYNVSMYNDWEKKFIDYTYFLCGTA